MALVDVLNASGDELPLVRDLDPYRLGATPSRYGDSSTYGLRDPYVPRAAGDVENKVQRALGTQRMVVIYGQSKAGKTRTAFEALHTWPDARLLAPKPSAIGRLAVHPSLQDMEGRVVVWLDDLEEYVTASDSLTSSALTQLCRRQGPTIVLATLRSEVRERLAAENGGRLTRDIRQLLSDAVEIELRPTSDSPAEQEIAARVYPDEDLSNRGLAEQLAGAPALLRLYRDSRVSNPVRYAVLQSAIDWARVGMQRPIPEDDLCELAKAAIQEEYPYITASDPEVRAAVRAASAPLSDHGRIQALPAERTNDGSRGYRAFEYLVAADDGQGGPSRPIRVDFWTRVLLRYARPEETYVVSKSAAIRGEISMAMQAARQGAESDQLEAMNVLGVLLAGYQDPPKRDEARRWFAEAVERGSTKALTNLARIALQDDPPGLAAALNLYRQAAERGSVVAMRSLGDMLTELDPRDLAEARAWFTCAADGGDIVSMTRLAQLSWDLQDPPDPDDAERWMKRAAEAGPSDLAGDMESMAFVGYQYARQYVRSGEEIYLLRAEEWFSRAAEAGDYSSMSALGRLYARLQDPPDLVKAKHWLTRAAEAGDADAMVSLTYLYANLEDPPDFAIAENWYARATAAGIADVSLHQQQLDDIA